MSKLERLEGGFINEVYKKDGVVLKHFSGDELVGKPAHLRARREKHSLVKFGGHLAPKLLGFDNKDELFQEFVQGELVENILEEIEYQVFVQAGEVLRKIHTPVNRNPEYLREDFESMLAVNYQTAKPLLAAEQVDIEICVDWPEVYRWGTTRVHRDFWLGNLIDTRDGLKVVDWEFSGIGSPYEDFAMVDLWIIRDNETRFPDVSRKFWQGYGVQPNQDIIKEFLKTRCIEFLSTTSINDYKKEPSGGFYHNKIALLRSLK